MSRAQSAELVSILAGLDDQALLERIEILGQKELEKLWALCGFKDGGFLAWARRHECTACKGRGKREEEVLPDPTWKRCDDCEGYGYDQEDLVTCSACAGEGGLAVQPPAELKTIFCGVCRGRCLDPKAFYDLRGFFLSHRAAGEIQARLRPQEYEEPLLPPSPSLASTQKSKAETMRRRREEGYATRHPVDLFLHDSPLARERHQRGVHNIRNGSAVAEPMHTAKSGAAEEPIEVRQLRAIRSLTPSILAAVAAACGLGPEELAEWIARHPCGCPAPASCQSCGGTKLKASAFFGLRDYLVNPGQTPGPLYRAWKTYHRPVRTAAKPRAGVILKFPGGERREACAS